MLYGFTLEQTERIGKMLRAYEEGKLGSSPLTPGGKHAPVETYVAKLTEEIAAISGDEPGSGVVEIHKIEDGSLVSTGFEVTAYNLGSEALAADSYVTIRREPVGGVFVCDVGGGGGGGAGNAALFEGSPILATTTNAWVTIAEWDAGTPKPLYGHWCIRNVGAANTARIKFTSTDVFGSTLDPYGFPYVGQFFFSPGQESGFTWLAYSGLYPFSYHKIEIIDDTAGLHADVRLDFVVFKGL